MSEHGWGANGPLARTVPVGARILPAAPGGELAPVAALLDRVRARLAGRLLRAFPAAAEATDRELARWAGAETRPRCSGKYAFWRWTEPDTRRPAAARPIRGTPIQSDRPTRSTPINHKEEPP